MVAARAAHLGASEDYVDAARVYTVEAAEADAGAAGDAAERWLAGGDAATGLGEGDRQMLLAEVRAVRAPPTKVPPDAGASSSSQVGFDEADGWDWERGLAPARDDSDAEEMAAQEALWGQGRAGARRTPWAKAPSAAASSATGAFGNDDGGALWAAGGALFAGALAVSLAIYHRRALGRVAADAFADVFLR